MKWDKPSGSVQMSSCGRYTVQKANSISWVAYALSPYGTGEKLGEGETDVKARSLCVAHEAQLYARRA